MSPTLLNWLESGLLSYDSGKRMPARTVNGIHLRKDNMSESYKTEVKQKQLIQNQNGADRLVQRAKCDFLSL